MTRLMCKYAQQTKCSWLQAGGAEEPNHISCPMAEPALVLVEAPHWIYIPSPAQTRPCHVELCVWNLLQERSGWVHLRVKMKSCSTPHFNKHLNKHVFSCCATASLFFGKRRKNDWPSCHGAILLPRVVQCLVKSTRFERFQDG